MKISSIFDIDGTITIPGYDLWFLTTQQLADNKNSFIKSVDEWKLTANKNNIINSSESMMNNGLAMIHYEEESIYNTCFNLTCNLHYKVNFIRLKAIESIRNHLNRNEEILLSTANYYHAALGFLDALIDLKLLNQQEAGCIKVEGSLINIIEQQVQHINVAENKTINIEHIGIAYGDDPLGNDRGLASKADTFYLIDTPKNRSINLYERLYW